MRWPAGVLCRPESPQERLPSERRNSSNRGDIIRCHSTQQGPGEEAKRSSWSSRPFSCLPHGKHSCVLGWMWSYLLEMAPLPAVPKGTALSPWVLPSWSHSQRPAQPRQGPLEVALRLAGMGLQWEPLLREFSQHVVCVT